MDLATFTNRFEIKYLVEARRFDEILAAFQGLLIPDPAGVENHGYYNYSIYFDSPRYRFYGEKHEGMQSRVKPRLRLYRSAIDATPSGYFLELKKRFDRIIRKERSKVTRAEAERLLTKGPISIDAKTDSPPALNEFIYARNRFCLLPCVTVLYHRAAFYSRIYPNLRMTFDRGLRCSLLTGLDNPLSAFSYALPPQQMVLELKYSERVPRLVLQRCRELELQQATFSKFAVCLEHCLSRSTAAGRARRMERWAPVTPTSR